MKPNYTEVYICENKNEAQKDMNGLDMLDINVSKNYFMRIIAKIAKQPSPYKSFKKSFKTYCFQDLFMENRDERDIEVFEKKMLMYVQDGNLVHTCYNRKKESFNVFPSTTNLNAIFLTKRLSFLVNSHIYINFDTCHYLEKNGEEEGDEEKQCIYKIFVNLNSEKNIDIENSRKLVRNAIDFVLR